MGLNKLADVERPKLGNAIYKHPLRPQMVVMDPSDNLPRPAVISSMTDTAAPPLSPDTMICMADESVFVIRDRFANIVCQVEGHLTVRMGDGAYRIKSEDLTPEQRTALEKVNESGLTIETWTVEPLRPQCFHYRRVMTDFEGQAEHQQIERVCTAQRTEGGEFTSLSDTRVMACEHRTPRDFVSEERLRRFDEQRIEDGKKTEEEWVPPAHGDKNG